MIVTVTLNAAIDKRYEVEKLETGEVNRVKSSRYGAGGKGLNVSRVAVTAKEAVTATGFAGGHTGQLLEELAQKDGIETAFVHTQGETRTCINIKDLKTGEQTELLEGGETVLPEKAAEMEEKYRELLTGADVVTISGSVPKGVDGKLYIRMIQMAKEAGIPVLVDTSGTLLLQCIEAAPDLIKPNQDEIKQITKKADLSKDELRETAVKIRDKGISYVVVSLGKDGSVMASPSGVYEARVPLIQAVNTVGCGDSMLAGLAIGIKNHWTDEEILRYASAISAANALQEATGFFVKSDFEELYKKITILK